MSNGLSVPQDPNGVALTDIYDRAIKDGEQGPFTTEVKIGTMVDRTFVFVTNKSGSDTIWVGAKGITVGKGFRIPAGGAGGFTFSFNIGGSGFFAISEGTSTIATLEVR